MRHKLLLTVLLLATASAYSSPAKALPGKTKTEVKNWVKNHRFLSTWLQEIRTIGIAEHFLAFRELKDQWFIDLRSYTDESGTIIESETLFLVKKSPSQSSEQEDVDPDGRLQLDKRRWKDIDCKNVWQRGNSTATTLLTEIYGKAVADDFNGAKLVYQGPIFTHPIYFDMVDFKVDRDIEGKPIEINSLTPTDEGHMILLGNRYSYTNETHGDQSFQRLCGLEIRPLAYGKRIADVYTYNQNVYKRLQNKKQVRDVPADIEVE